MSNNFLFADTCEGDSVGSMMYYSKQYRQWIVAGITSDGYGCGESNHAGVYTRISMYIDWIKSIAGIDSVFIAGENSANSGTVSNLVFISAISFVILLYC
jgi:secreted trypsin-like serine protease